MFCGLALEIKYKNMTKSLKEKAIDFKGKKYVLVADRVVYFNDTYPTGSIATEILSQLDSQTVIVKAIVKPEEDKTRIFTGHSQAVIGEGFVNKTSALENAETSAIGRALAMMGIGVLDSIASIDEIKKAENLSANRRYYSQGANVIKKVQPIIPLPDTPD